MTPLFSALQLPGWQTTYTLDDGTTHTFESACPAMADHAHLFRLQVVRELEDQGKKVHNRQHTLVWQPQP